MWNVYERDGSACNHYESDDSGDSGDVQRYELPV